MQRFKIFKKNGTGELMSDYCLTDIKFIKYDDDGNTICDLKGNPKSFTFKNDIDLTFITETIQDDEMEECE